jgi:hypothetical protein|tara:strand:- start:699 stop:875 length:177 start_codon:yes stop_codon:yes gene_type:complete
MSFAKSYLRIIKKIYNDKYYPVKRGVHRNDVNSLLNGRDIRLSAAHKAAQAIGVTLEE